VEWSTARVRDNLRKLENSVTLMEDDFDKKELEATEYEWAVKELCLRLSPLIGRDPASIENEVLTDAERACAPVVEWQAREEGTISEPTGEAVGNRVG